MVTMKGHMRRSLTPWSMAPGWVSPGASDGAGAGGDEGDDALHVNYGLHRRDGKLFENRPVWFGEDSKFYA